MNNSPLAVALVHKEPALFELGIAAELFGLSRPEVGVPWYDFKIVSVEGGVGMALGGMKILAKSSLSELRKANTIIIPGWGSDKIPTPTLIRELRSAHARGARFLSICSGVFLLARAGLLDGKRATTHWHFTELLQERFNTIKVVPDVLYVDEGQIITSAGSAAGIDAGLHLIRRDFGVTIANQVARRLVATPHRSGGQKQYIPTPIHARVNERFEGLLEWISERLDQPFTIRQLAEQVAMSERNFLRRFSETTGTTPKAWLQQVRIGRARELMESTQFSCEEITRQCGFLSIETFRSSFRKEVGVPPTVYRRQFHT